MNARRIRHPVGYHHHNIVFPQNTPDVFRFHIVQDPHRQRGGANHIHLFSSFDIGGGGTDFNQFRFRSELVKNKQVQGGKTLFRAAQEQKGVQ